MILIKDRHGQLRQKLIQMYRGNMILIKDRHTELGTYNMNTHTMGNMILIKDRHANPSGRVVEPSGSRGNMILIKDRHYLLSYPFGLMARREI